MHTQVYVYTHTHTHIHSHALVLVFRKLLCDVVKIKVESEERMNRITRGNGDEIIGVSAKTTLLLYYLNLYLINRSNFLRRK